MKLNTQNIDIDGEVYNFYFVKNGENKGKGFGTATVNDEYTINNKVAASEGVVATSFVYDDKAVYVNGLKVTADSDLRYQAVDITTGKTYTRSEVAAGIEGVNQNHLVLINASGSIMKNKSSVKDGDDYYYSTNKYGVITAIGSEKEGLDKDDEEFAKYNRYDNLDFDC